MDVIKKNMHMLQIYMFMCRSNFLKVIHKYRKNKSFTSLEVIFICKFQDNYNYVQRSNLIAAEKI